MVEVVDPGVAAMPQPLPPRLPAAESVDVDDAAGIEVADPDFPLPHALSATAALVANSHRAIVAWGRR